MEESPVVLVLCLAGCTCFWLDHDEMVTSLDRLRLMSESKVELPETARTVALIGRLRPIL